MPAARVLVMLALLSVRAITVHAASFPDLTVAVDSAGLAQVRAVLVLPANPAVVRSVLVDYSRWPLLFPSGLRVIGIKEEQRGVQTDLYLPWHFPLGALHLVTITREPVPGVLETRLIDGDFRQYWRLWVLIPGQHADETHAELEMEVQLKSWLPNWIFARVLRRELLEHFEKLQTQVKLRS